MSLVVWTYAALGSYHAPDDSPWTEEEKDTYNLVYDRGYSEYSVLQGMLAVLVCLFYKRRRRYPKLAVPQALDIDAVRKLERQFPEENELMRHYLAERIILLLIGTDLPSCLKLYELMDQMNENIQMGIFTLNGSKIFPLINDLFDRKFVIDQNITVWLLQNEYVGPLFSWYACFLVEDKMQYGHDLIVAIENGLRINKERLDISYGYIKGMFSDTIVSSKETRYESSVLLNEEIDLINTQYVDTQFGFSSSHLFKKDKRDPFPINSPAQTKAAYHRMSQMTYVEETPRHTSSSPSLSISPYEEEVNTIEESPITISDEESPPYTANVERVPTNYDADANRVTGNYNI